jgi:hypothetical protein
MLTRRPILAIALTLALALVPVVATATGSGDDHAPRFVLGFNLHSTGPSTTVGTFVVSGALRDSGTSTVEGLTLVPLGHGDRARLSGVQRFIGSGGTVVTRFSGIARDISDPHQWADGRFRIVDASGRYQDLHGGGRFTIVVDTTSNQLIGTERGHGQ